MYLQFYLRVFKSSTFSKLFQDNKPKEINDISEEQLKEINKRPLEPVIQLCSSTNEFGESRCFKGCDNDVVSEVPTVQDLNKLKINDLSNIKMWLWDIWEDPFKKPGQIFLFGKALLNGIPTSTCLQIQNVEHCLYFLPRKTVCLIPNHAILHNHCIRVIIFP